MKTKNKQSLLAAALFCALAFTTTTHAQTVESATKTQPAAADSTNGQSETEQTAATRKKKAAQAIASADRLTTPAQKVALVTARSTAKVSEAAERDWADPQTPAPAAEDAAELAKKLSNPLAAMISFPMQSNFDFGMGTGSGWKYTLNMQPVIPIALSPKWNLISRTIVPIIHQGNVTSPGQSQSGLGDITQSLFFSPNKSEPFIWGLVQ